MNEAIFKLVDKDINRFWLNVDIGEDHECWPWKGVLVKGYGQLSVGQDKHIAAHQIAAYLAHGKPNPVDLYTLHKCDNRPCCNPSHLFYGTNQDNQKDASLKGRSAGQNGTVTTRGCNNGRAKLTEDQVVLIRFDNSTTKKLAARFGVSQQLISAIKLKQVWRHI